MSPQAPWTVALEVGADTRFLHVVRLTAAGAAAEAGLDAEQVEDVKIAVDELCSLMIAAGSATALTLRFHGDDDGLVVEGSGVQGPWEVDELAAAILDATLDQLEVGAAAPAGGFRLSKRRLVEHRRGH